MDNNIYLYNINLHNRLLQLRKQVLLLEIHTINCKGLNKESVL